METRWRVFLYFKNGMSLVTFEIACAYSFAAACQIADEIKMTRNKKRGILFKKVGDGRRVYTVQEYQQWYGWQEYEAAPPPEPTPEPAPTHTQLPLLEATTDNPFKSIWRKDEPIKRRL